MSLTLPLILTLTAGVVILLFGRRLFWLYVAMVGFLVGFDLAQLYLLNQPQWFHIVAGIGVGLVAALAAILLQAVTIGLAGFMSGAYLAGILFEFLALPGASHWLWISLLTGGVLGAVLFLLVLDTALVLLSATIGAVVLVTPFNLDPVMSYALLMVLAVAGALFQFAVLSAGQHRQGSDS